MNTKTIMILIHSIFLWSCQAPPGPGGEAVAEAAVPAIPETPKAQVPTWTSRPTAQIQKDGNHLKDQGSVYLQQHAYNPLEWYPWGEEALSRSRMEDKPIFLSIGYASCHWCHVMEHEVFEHEDVASFMN